MKRCSLVWVTSLISIFLLSSHILAGKDNLLRLVGIDPMFAKLPYDIQYKIAWRIMRKRCPDAFFSLCKVSSFQLETCIDPSDFHISAVVWNPHDSHQIVLGTRKGFIIFMQCYKKKKWKRRRFFRASNNAIHSIAFHPHDPYCLTIVSGTKILLWRYNKKDRLWQHSATLENNHETVSLVWNPNNFCQIASICLCDPCYGGGSLIIWHFNAEANEWSKKISSVFNGFPCRNGIMWYSQRNFPTMVRANCFPKYNHFFMYIDNCPGTYSGELGFMKIGDNEACLHPWDMQRILSWGYGSVLSVWDFASSDCDYLKRMNKLYFGDFVLAACWNPHDDGQILTVLKGNKVRIVDLCGIPHDASYQKGDLILYQVAFILLLYAEAWRTKNNTFKDIATHANICEDGRSRPKEKRITAGDLREVYDTFNSNIREYLQQRYHLPM